MSQTVVSGMSSVENQSTVNLPDKYTTKEMYNKTVQESILVLKTEQILF